VDEQTQAFLLARAYLLALAHPSVEKVFWYDFRNDTLTSRPYEQPAHNPHEGEFNFGLLRRAYPLDPAQATLRKPAFLAYRALAEQLAGLAPQEVLRDSADGVYWHRYARAAAASTCSGAPARARRSSWSAAAARPWCAPGTGASATC
jgi:hypothetical protein